MVTVSKTQRDFRMGSPEPEAQVQIQALTLSSSGTSSKLLNILTPQFLHL